MAASSNESVFFQVGKLVVVDERQSTTAPTITFNSPEPVGRSVSQAGWQTDKQARARERTSKQTLFAVNSSSFLLLPSGKARQGKEESLVVQRAASSSFGQISLPLAPAFPGAAAAADEHRFFWWQPTKDSSGCFSLFGFLSRHASLVHSL